MGENSKSNSPDLTGELDDGSNVALWENEKEKENQPDFTGVINYEDGETERIALWKTD